MGYHDLFLSCNLQESSQQALVCVPGTEGHYSWNKYFQGFVILLGPKNQLQKNHSYHSSFVKLR